MLLWKTIDIADNERALLFRRDNFERVLEPGRHRLRALGGKARVEVFDITDVAFKHKNAKFLMKTYAARLSDYIGSIELNDIQVGLIYSDQHLIDILAPGAFFSYWKGAEEIKVDVINIDKSFDIHDSLLSLLGRGLKIGRSKEVLTAISYNEVPDERVGLLQVNGVEALLPQNLLDIYKIRGAMANNFKKQEADLKSIANSGWNAELIPEQEILASQFPEVLAGIEKDQARISELEALFAAANESDSEGEDSGSDGSDEGEKSGALPKAKVTELKNNKKEHNGQLKDLKKELRYLKKDTSVEATARSEELNQHIAQRTEAVQQIDQQLAAHTALEQELKNLKAGLKDNEKKRDDLIDAARAKIDAEEAKMLIEARFRQDLQTELEAYLRAFTADLIKSVENLHNKYAVTVKQILSERDKQAELMDGFMRELGYA